MKGKCTANMIMEQSCGVCRQKIYTLTCRVAPHAIFIVTPSLK